VYRKVFIVVLVLLMFVNVPVYANEVYNLEQGKVYRFKNGGKPFVFDELE